MHSQLLPMISPGRISDKDAKLHEQLEYFINQDMPGIRDIKFRAGKNIKGLHVLFQPEVKTDTTGQRRKTFITGCTVQEAPKNDVDTSKPSESGNSSSSSNQSSTGGGLPDDGD